MIQVNPFRHKNDSWEVGARVKVGFLQLTVKGKEATPGDGYPDAYLLESSKGVQYRFVPHMGLERID